MKVLVCGGRDYCDVKHVFDVLDHLLHRPTVIIHGAAKGADECAHRWALANEVEERIFPADWATHGKAAGPLRNQQMLELGRPELVVAFPGGRGTADMVRRAIAVGINTIEVGRRE